MYEGMMCTDSCPPKEADRPKNTQRLRVFYPAAHAGAHLVPSPSRKRAPLLIPV